MSRPTNHISYTSAWASVVTEHPGSTPIRLHLASEQEAKGVRLTFYSWRKALERRDPGLYALAAPLTLRIEPTATGGATLVIEHVDHTPAARALYAALDEAKRVAGPTGAQPEAQPAQAPAPRESHDDTIMRLLGLGTAHAQDDNGAESDPESAP